MGAGMAKMVWICSVCGRQHDTKDAAEGCEEQHQTRHQVRIKALAFAPGFPRRIPNEVILQLSDNDLDFALYHFVHHGPRGV